MFWHSYGVTRFFKARFPTMEDDPLRDHYSKPVRGGDGPEAAEGPVCHCKVAVIVFSGNQ